jgi:hypothetical protein
MRQMEVWNVKVRHYRAMVRKLSPGIIVENAAVRGMAVRSGSVKYMIYFMFRSSRWVGVLGQDARTHVPSCELWTKPQEGGVLRRLGNRLSVWS